MDFLRNKLSFPVPDSAVELFSRTEVDGFLQTHTDVVLKAPISGSGRGVWRCFGSLSQSAEGWCKRTLCKQGSVMGEPLYPKVQDFAMEFLLKNGKASFAGYSVFETEAMGVYSANILAANGELERRLSEYIPLTYLHDIRDALSLFFEREYSFYEGYLGVDMLIYNENGHYLVNPMIEINLRMTMGMAACRFFDAFVCESSTGIFRIEMAGSLPHNAAASPLENNRPSYPKRIHHTLPDNSTYEIRRVGADRVRRWFRYNPFLMETKRYRQRIAEQRW